jgi:hypothetical protein
MCDVLFIVEELLITCNTLAESEKITKFCSEFMFSMIYNVSLISNASGVIVDAVFHILNFMLR